MILAILALVGAVLLAASAEARLKFSPPQTLSPTGQSASDPTLAIDSQDRATVAWLRFDGANERIESVRVGADGIPGEVSTLLATASDSLLGPQVAVDPQARTTVVWERDTLAVNASDCSPTTNTTCVQGVRFDVSGNPGTLQTLARFDTPERDPDLGGPGDGPQAAVDAQGRVTVVWRRLEYTAAGADSTVQSVRLGADGAPGTVQTLSENGAGEPKVAVDSQGRATVVWPRDRRIESVRLGADGTPEAVKTLSKRGQNADSPEVAVDPQGGATVVWRRADRAKRRIQSVRLGADGAPEAVKTLSKGADSPEVAVDPRGRSTVVWRRIKQTKRSLVVRVQSVHLDADGAPRAVKTLSKERAFDPQVAVDRRGRATVVWERLRLGGGGISRIEARHLSARGAPEPVQTLAKAEGVGSPEVAVDSKHRPTVVWALSELSVGGLIQSARAEIGAG